MVSSRGFPFVGAGEASYFEWAEVHVRFTRTPTPAERRRIAKDVPPPIGNLKWDDALLSASSEQGVGRQIKAAYQSPAKKTAPTPLVMQNRFAQASPSADGRFNAHIEEWLLGAHAVVPVLVAYRRQDHEAGGTQLSDWHHASMHAVPAVLGALAKVASESDADLAERLAAWAESESIAIDASLRRTIVTLKDAKEKAEELAREERWARLASEHAAAVAELDRATPKTKGKALTAVETTKAIASLAKVMPAFAKRLAKVDPASLSLRAGASKSAIAEVEKALGQTLIPEHRALLSAFDGGRIRDLVIPGTPGGGGRGRNDLVAVSRTFSAHDGKPWALTVALHDPPKTTLLLARVLNGKPSVFLQAEHRGQTLKSSKRLDGVLDQLLKECLAR
jgi:hypothetical protein